jgi:hypothetical protein
VYTTQLASADRSSVNIRQRRRARVVARAYTRTRRPLITWTSALFLSLWHDPLATDTLSFYIDSAAGVEADR